MNLFRLDGRVALVTGASSGLGARFAAVLHAAGAAVVLTARREDRLRRLAAELSAAEAAGTGGALAGAAGGAEAGGTGPAGAAGDRVAVLAGDLREPAVRAAAVDLAASRFGRLDVLVNNAGTCDGGPLHEQSLAAVTDVLTLNLVAAVDLCRLAGPLLFAQPGSSVINVASIYGVVGSRAPMTAYNASKGALVNLTRHLAAQWGGRGVRVNALAPGFFPTELTGGLENPGQRAMIEERTLLGRIPDVSELDGPLLFLAGAAASYVTGQVLVVDGGWTAC